MDCRTKVTVFILAVACALGCNEPKTISTPLLDLVPENFLVPKVPYQPGCQEICQMDPASSEVNCTTCRVVRTVRATNTGNQDLIISDVSLDIEMMFEEFQLNYQLLNSADPTLRVGISSQDEDRFTYPIVLAPGNEIIFDLSYSPQREELGEDENLDGVLLLQTNLSTSGGRVRVPIVISEGSPQISVYPPRINFQQVRAGEGMVREVRVRNIGERPLDIEEIRLDGSIDFRPLIEEDGMLRDPRELEGTLRTLDADEFMTVQVRYLTEFEGPDEGTLYIRSNDPEEPEVLIPLSANVDTPCLSVSPGAVEFRTSLVDREDSRALLVQSCGKVPVTIRSVRLRDDSDPAFDLNRESMPPELSTPDGLILPGYTQEDRNEGRPPPMRELEITFSPREQRIHNGTLVIETDDPQFPEREVSILGRGVINACPQARAVQENFAVVPLDTILLDGTPSIDQDGPDNLPVEYQWVITSRPEGSSSLPVEAFFDASQPSSGGRPDDLRTPTAAFFVDLAGTYTAELRVRDNLGLNSESCGNAAVVTIIARPREAIHIQLTWDTPGDQNLEDGTGADLDLHLLHPYAQTWGQRGLVDEYDCFFLNGTPDWGQTGNESDNPTLDIDNFTGGGPENISLSEPENTTALGGTYQVGVHYYSSVDRETLFDYGPSSARLRVYIRGELTWDFTDSSVAGGNNPGLKEMTSTGHFWNAAEISWPEGEVTTRDLYWLELPN